MKKPISSKTVKTGSQRAIPSVYTQSIPTPLLATVVEPTPEPQPEPEIIPEPESVIPKEINLESYLKLYEEMLQYKTELITTKKRLLEVEVKETKKTKYNPDAVDMKDKLINLLLESDLNIEAIPDDVERQIYRTILDYLDTGITTATKCCSIM